MTHDQLTKQRSAAPQAEDLDIQDIARIVDTHGGGRSTLMAVLGEIQAKYRYLPQDALRIVAERIRVPLVDVYAAATFYHSFSLKPKGKHIVLCCQGTACHVRGGSGIAEELQRQLGVAPGETTPDKQFTFETVNCLGACALGPVVVVDGRYYPKVRRSQVSQILKDTAAGSTEARAALDGRLIPLDASCPHCGRNLMDESRCLDGRASIRLSFSANGYRGRVSLSSLYGSSRLEMEPDRAIVSAIELSCPHCTRPLAGHWECPECGVPMAVVSVRGGGEAHFCPRRECSGRFLDLEGRQLPNAVNGGR